MSTNTAAAESEMDPFEHVIFFMNILSVVVPYLYSILDSGISALKSPIAWYSKKRDLETKYSYIAPSERFLHLYFAFAMSTHTRLGRDVDEFMKESINSEDVMRMVHSHFI